jgi:hypothetical protein
MADYRTPAPLKIKTFGKKRPQPVGPAAIERAEGQLSTQSRHSLLPVGTMTTPYGISTTRTVGRLSSPSFLRPFG